MPVVVNAVPARVHRVGRSPSQSMEKGMAISSYGVKILPTKLFEEEERKLEGVDFGPETESIQSSKTTESVASIFQANAEYIQHLERSPPKPRGLYEQSFENNLK